MRFQAAIPSAFGLALTAATLCLAIEDDSPSQCAACDDKICPPHWKGGLKPMSPLPLLQDTDTPLGGTLKVFHYEHDLSTNIQYFFRYKLPGPRNDLNGSVLAVRYLKSVVGDTSGQKQQTPPPPIFAISKRVQVDAAEQREARLAEKNDTTPVDFTQTDAKVDSSTDKGKEVDAKDIFTDFQYYVVQNGLLCEVLSPINNQGNKNADVDFFAADIHYHEYIIKEQT